MRISCTASREEPPQVRSESQQLDLRRVIAGCVILYLLSALCAAAQQFVPETIRQMVHTTWTGRNGAPQGISALAQKPDGRLWIGTVAGLYSYDGFSFTPFPLPKTAAGSVLSRKVQSLFVARDGGLWVIGQGEGAVLVRNKASEDVGLFEGQHARFDSLQQDAQGRIWAVVNDRFLAFCTQDHVWHLAPTPVAHPSLISGIYIDSSDALWAVVDDHLYRRATGQTQFTSTGSIAEGGIHFAQAADRSIWLVGQAPKRYNGEIHGIDLRHLSAEGQPLTLPFVHSDVNAVLVSHDASLWVLESDIGPHGVRTPALTRHQWRQEAWHTDRITSAQGLGDNDSHAMIEDADGSLWVGGERQLERFRPSALVPLTPGLVGSSWIFCANPHGGLWVGSGSSMLMRVIGERQRMVYGQDEPYKLFCRKDGSAWMLDARGLSLVRDSEIHRYPLLSGHGSYLDNWGFSDLLETRDHRVIVAEQGSTESRLWQLSHGRWQPFAPDLAGHPVHASFEDDDGTMYFGGLKNFVVAVNGQKVTRVPVKGGVLGSVSVLQKLRGQLFALGSEGIAVYRSGAFYRLIFAVPEDAEMSSGMVQTPEGDAWLNGRRGIVHVARSELEAAVDDPGHAIVSEEVHEGDFVGPSLSGLTSSSVVRDTNDTLWFSTLNGIVSLNPTASSLPVQAPALHIESDDADGQPFPDGASLPPHIATLRIRYLGLNLTKPEEVTYSYQLQGLDHGWQNVGHRTEAVYTSLKPGRYRFLVKASYGDSRWTEAIALNLRVRPTFYQTWCFVLLCAIFVLLLFTLVLQVRVRLLANTLRERAEQRADERIRIARDLHDTLLQGMQGLLLSFHVAAKSTPEHSPTRDLLERAMVSADRLLLEGRNRVSGLRDADHSGRIDLLTSLRRAGQELSTGDQEVLYATSDGDPRPLQSSAAEELYFLGREALTNAFRHSGATKIDIVLQYAPQSFKLLCIDNGSGFRADEPFLDGSHWGIQGMKERAQRRGGKLTIESTLGAGTRVVASFPAREIYSGEQKHSLWRRLLREGLPFTR